MSNTDFDSLDRDDPDLFKKMRKMIEERDSKISDLSSRVSTYEAKERTSTLAEKIAAKNLNPKIAALVPKDLSDEDLDTWLNEYGDLFGVPAAPAQQEDPNAAIAAEAQRQALAMQGAQSAMPGDAMSRIASAENWDELQAVLKSL
jgi:ribosomal protein L12E/L44/L45/RPP1/RPP2